MQPQNQKIEAVSQEQAVSALWQAGYLQYKLWPQQVHIHETVKAMPITIQTVVLLCARQFGKCHAKGTDVLTPNGPKPIENMQIGDVVYGYNKDGSITPCRVKNVSYQGKQLVWDLGSRDRHVVSSTPNHRWLSRWKVGSDTDRYHYRYEQEQTTDQIINGRARKIARVFVDIPCGDVDEPHAYVLGALFGDGCGKQGGNRIAISSENDDIPKKIAAILGVKHLFNDKCNFTWYLSSIPKGLKKAGFMKHGEVIRCHHYDDWIKNRLSREKTYDWDVINSWDRSSLLAFMAGLVDTDGSVVVAPCGTLNIRFSNTNRSLIDLFCRCFYKLFQHKPGITTSNRRDKYGEIEYSVSIINNLICKRALKQLDEHLVCPRKKWKSDYEKLKEYNAKLDRIGLKKIGEREADTYDIEVDNETNLYVLANQGLITHNSVLGCILALEDCLRNPNIVVLIVGPTIKQTRAIVRPRMKLLMHDCPEGLIRPVKSEDTWYFANGSELKLGGFDTNSSAERGKTLYRVYIEEIVDSNPDDYLSFLRSDLAPALTHSKHAQIVYLTTLPRYPDHPFILETMPESIVKGAFFKYTIHDNKKLSQEQYDALVKLMGGEDSIDFKRECLCEIVRDSTIILAPEFSDNIHVKECKRLDFAHYWISGDTGGIRDKSVFHLMDYDFKRNKIRFLDERSYDPETSSAVMAAEVLEMERGYNITARFVDAPGQLQIDLMYQHNFPCALPRKDELEATVNQVRVSLRMAEVEIDPKCKLLILTLRSGTFNKNHTDLERNSSMGHMDAFMSCAYGIRHANRSNPYPLYGGANHFTHYIDGSDPERTASAKAIQSIFSLRG